MFIKLKDGRNLNILYLADCFQGKHDKTIVIFYLVNGTKLIENYDTEADAETRVAEVDDILASGFGGSGTAVKDGGVVQKSTKNGFPATGDVKNLYIATDTHTPYYWDITTKKYVSIGGGGSAVLEKDITSNKDCGAAPAKTFFAEGTTFTEFAEMILRTDIHPNFAVSFSNVGIKECGYVIPSTLMKLSISNLSDVTYGINGTNFYLDSTVVGSDNVVSSGKITYQYNHTSAIQSDVPKVITPKAELVYDTNRKKSATNGTFQFVYASYYGMCNVGTITSAIANNIVSQWTVNNTAGSKTLVEGVFAKRISASRAFDYTNVTLNDQRFFYMYPSSLGALTNILDGNGFKYLDSYTVTTVNVTTTNGQTVPYFVYLLTDPTTNTGLIQKYS